jgi:hypothetical protein
LHTSDRYLSNSMTGQAPGDTRVANNRPGAGAELRHYHLKCHFCGAVFKDDGSLLECPVEHAPSLLVSQYSARQLRCDNSAEGIYRYRGWLPIVRELSGSGRTVTFQSAKLRHITGLPNSGSLLMAIGRRRGQVSKQRLSKNLRLIQPSHAFPRIGSVC